jgi:hypothetical protein
MATDDSDPMRELAAMQRVAEALSDLPAESVARILRWAAESHGVSGPRLSLAVSDSGRGYESATVSETASPYSDIAELFSAASPRTGTESALVGGYWFQVINGQPDFDSLSLNRELKNLGRGASNITAALSSLMSQRPQLVIQTKKVGKSFQARKRYRLTQEGISRVRSMIGRRPAELSPMKEET